MDETLTACEPLETVGTSKSRARELYKYFIPKQSDQVQPPDTVLCAHAQLLSWRLNCRRAMVSLLDQHTQYFIAESSKTLDLDDPSLFTDPDDALWAGCSNVPKAGRLCEHTIRAGLMNSPPHYFEVLDLTLDSRFNTLSFVSGPPFFRYYCGVPLVTKNAIPIGSIFVLDHQPRPPLSPNQIGLMVTMASNCMSHLEGIKEKEDLRRSKNMSLCIAAFVDPENRSDYRRRRKHSQKHSHLPSASILAQDEMESATVAPLVVDSADTTTTKKSPSSPHSPSTHNSDRIDHDHDRDHDRDQDLEDHSNLMQSSVDLLLNSLGLDVSGSTGGIVFFDSGTSLQSFSHPSLQNDDSSEDGADPEPLSTRPPWGKTTQVSYNSWSGYASNPHAVSNYSRPCDILAASQPFAQDSDSLSSPLFTPPSQYDLTRLIKKHPRGMLCNLSEDDNLSASASSGDETLGKDTYKMPEASVLPSNTDLNIFQSHFPTARQVIFVPFWVSSWSRYAAFVIYNTSPFRAFARSPDFLHCIAFSHCITTELSRMATMTADQQKSDFIGSVSHELRTPVHGILASCEFLLETSLSTFQRSLVNTSDGCARTLLDTINMVLDYSKINAFERSISKSKRTRHWKNSIETPHQPSLNLYGDVDLAAITEEVVEGVATGQAFKDNIGNLDAIDSVGPLYVHEKLGDTPPPTTPKVEVLIDMPPRNWFFFTQPGAFRRVVMNLFGNAIKYTSSGHIQVQLSAHKITTAAPTTSKAAATTTTTYLENDAGGDIEIVTLVIKDTGQGISPHYMKTKLFTPFAQENSIAPGTGLGLSLVRSIVRMLKGEIDIQSTVGVGTIVAVKFPMSRPATATQSNAPTAAPTSIHSATLTTTTPSSAGSVDRAKDDSLEVLRELAKGRTAYYYSPSSSNYDKVQHNEGQPIDLMQTSVKAYLTTWYGFSMAKSLSCDIALDIVLCTEAHISSLLEVLQLPENLKHKPTIIVICSASSWNKNNSSMTGTGGTGTGTSKKIVSKYRTEPITYPLGPYKLARLVRVCLEDLANTTAASMSESTDSVKQNSCQPGDAFTPVVPAVENLKLGPDIKVVQQGQMMANEECASLMVAALSSQTTRSIEQESGFPFPGVSDASGVLSPSPEFEQAQQYLREENLPTTPPPPPPPLPGSGSNNNDDTGIKINSSSKLGQAKEDSTPQKLGATASALRQLYKPRVLCVDDNAVNLKLLQTFVAKRGYSDIHLASDGAQAVSLYCSLLMASTPLDIIFMDISMPVMNGFEATRRIRERERNARLNRSTQQVPPPGPPVMIIALTGLASERDQIEAFSSGIDIYLVKPIRFLDVGKLLSNWESRYYQTRADLESLPVLTQHGGNMQPETALDLKSTNYIST